MRYKFILFVLILVLGIALRLYTFSQISSVDQFTWIGGDEATYYNEAINIQQGRGPVIDFVFQFWERRNFGENDGLWEPMFSFVLAYFFYGLGSSLLAAKIIVFLISIAAIVLIYFIGKEIYSKEIGLIAMFLLAIQPKHIEYSATLLKDNLYAFFFLLAFFFMILAFGKGQKKHWVIFGAALALAFLTRYFSIILVLTFLAMLFSHRKKVNWKYVGFGAAAFILILLPWAIYTYNEFGSPFFSVTRYYPYSSSGWEGMSYEDNAPSLKEYLKENSILDLIKVRLNLIPLTIYHLPIWMTPLIFLLFILVFALKDDYSQGLKYYFVILIAFYLVQFASISQFNERAFFALMYTSLVPISFVIHKISVSGKRFKVKLDEKKILAVILLIALILSIVLLQWKLNGIKSYKMQERGEALQGVGSWIKQNTLKESVIMTILPAEIHYYTERRAVMDPYNLALSLGNVNITGLEWRNKAEGEYYNVNYVLLHTSNKTAKEGYKFFSMREVYSDKKAELFLYKVNKIV